MKNSLYQSLLSRLKNKHTKLASRFHKSVKDGEFQKQRYRKRKESIERLKSIERRISKIGRESGLKPNLNYKHWAVAIAMGVVVSASAQETGENFKSRLEKAVKSRSVGIQPLAQSIFFEDKVGIGVPLFNQFHTGDIDGDGDLDAIYVPYLESPTILRNDGSSNFTAEPLTSVPLEIVELTILDDFDGDGDLDLFMRNGSYGAIGTQMWLNDGTGYFTAQAAAFPPVDYDDDRLFTEDIDGDGDLDFVSETQMDNSPFYSFVTVFDNVGFDFTDTTAYKGSYVFSQSSRLVSAMDVDGDNDVDIVYTSVVPSFSSYGVQILENDGSGNLSQANSYLAPTSNFEEGAVPLDFDNDGDLDLISFPFSPDIRVRPFSSNGTIPTDGSSPFSEETDLILQPSGGREILLPALIDSDNNEDFVANSEDSTFVAISNGDGSFTELAKFAGQASPGDLDGDGDGDLFYFDGNVSIRDNQGGGTFDQGADILTISATYDTKLVDLDGDGDLDLAEGGATVSRSWLNNGNGEFTINQEFPGDAYQLAFGDLDGDSDMDMVVALEGDGSYPGFIIYTNDGAGNLTYNSNLGTGYETDQIVLADMDEDGDLDIVARQDGLSTDFIAIYDNQGSLTFSQTSSYPNPNGEKMDLGNIDIDTDMDIVIAMENMGFSTILNNSGALVGGETFTPAGVNFEITDVDLADLDGDGDLDLFASNGYESPTTNSYVFLNNGSGTFTDSGLNVESGGTYGSFIGDLDGDGDMDVISGGYIAYPKLWVNDGSGLLEFDHDIPTITTEYSSVNIGDLDGDGDADIVIGDYYGGTNIFFNSGGTGPSPLEPDSTALVNIFDSMGGEDWVTNTNWKSGDVSTWHGVFLNTDGDRVERLELPDNGLTGTLPASIDQLDALTNLDLSGNQINALATEFSTLVNVLDINLNGNSLDFEDLEPVAGVSVLSYTSQAEIAAIDQTGTIEIPVGSSQELTANANGTANTYQWTYNGQPIDGATETTYLVDDINRSNMGEYGLEISNSIATGVTLSATPVEVLATAIISITVTDDDDTNISELVNGYILEIQEGVVGFDTVSTATQEGVASSFTFPAVVLGDFLVNVSSDEALYIPTYYGDAFLWDEADTLVLDTDTARQIVITSVPPILNDDDVGLVEGTIEEDFDDKEGRIDARRRASKRKCGLRRKRTGGRTGQDDEFELIAYGETDENGEFAYGFLPQGTYRFFVEYPGIPLDESAFVQFDIGEEGVSDTSFKLAVFASDEGIFIELVLGLTSPYFSEFKIFPNPTADVINIHYEQTKSGELTLEVFDLNGKEMMRKVFNAKQEDITVDISDFEKGQYVFRVIDSSRKDLVVYKIIKN